MARRLVVVGGDAGGLAGASQARRLDAELSIVAFERGRWTSYSACGIPYVVAGSVDGLDRLVARTPEEHRSRSGIDVRTGHEVTALDLDRRRVEVRDLAAGRTAWEPFDELLLGTGAVPVRPDLPGIDLPSVQGVQTLADAEVLLAYAEKVACRSVVVVGGGYIGLEMAEAFLARGASVTVVEGADHVMGTLDADMAELVEAAMAGMGIEVWTGTTVEGFEDGAVHTSGGRLPADLVVLGLGVRPATELAEAAGITTGAKGAVRVDRRQRTSAEGVWAAGDCCESYHLLTREWTHVALGTVANRQARVAGINIGGGYATFPGVVGTAVTKVCSTEVARTGLTEREAAGAGFAARGVKIESTTRSGYFPGARPLTVKLVVEERTGRVLGGQIVGEEGAAKRIDVVAVAVTAGLTAEEVVNLDLSYAPPFSPLWDPVATAARRARGS